MPAVVPLELQALREYLLRRPLLPAAGFFVAGIACHRGVGFCAVPALAAAAAALIAWVFARNRPVLAAILLALATFLTGLIAAQLEAFAWPADHIAHYTAVRQRPAELELRIDTEPRILRNTVSPRAPAAHQVALATVVRVRTTAGWKGASGRICISIAEPLPGLAPGQKLCAFGMLHRPPAALNEGQFDWARYYRDDRILAGLYVARSAQVRVLWSPALSPLALARRLVRAALWRGFDEDRALDHALLRALVLGDSDPQLRDVQEQFLRSGTSHHLAISGMHIVVLGALVYGICRLLLLGPRAAAWTGLAAVVAYGLVALPSPPVVRSVLLCSAYAVGLLARRWVDGIQLLSLSVLIMLVFRPLDVYSAGFQLSFGTVLGLMLLTRPAMRLLAAPDRHETVARLVAPTRPLAAAMSRVRRWLIEGLVAGVVAWLVSAPIIAFHFDQLNPWATAASLALAIPVFLALVGGLLKIVLTLLLPFAAGPLATIAAIPVSWMRHGVDWLSRIPGSDVVFPQPPPWLLAAYYGVLILFLIPRPPEESQSAPAPVQPRYIGVLRYSPLAALALLLGWFAAHLPGRPMSETRLTVLAVGAGHCAVVRLASGAVVLVDGGSSSMSDPARACILPALRRMGVRRIEAVFISHADMDHVNALADVARHIEISQVLVGPAFAQQTREYRAAQELAEVLSRQGRPSVPVARGSRIGLDDSTFIDVLWPPADAQLSANDSSLVLRLCTAGGSVLFPGDAERAAQRGLLSRPESLRADVLIAPHHGSPQPVLAELLNAIAPRLIVVSSDRPDVFRRRAFEKLAGGRRVVYTGESGAVTVTLRPAGPMRAETFAQPGRAVDLR